jgi:A/G-specific adenine glycosylase
MPKHRDQTPHPVRLGLKRKEGLRKKLLAWYSVQQRDLPWRGAKDPYAVWISEVMLQQTQVQTVIPYYLRFLKAFPTIEHLARADTQELLRLWAGLGYYSRAKNLQRAAREIIRCHAGKFPSSYAEALALPGIGRYTAGAILSIAFDLPCPVLDGNIVRVLTRLFSLRGDPKERRLQNLLWQHAQELVPNRHPGDFNQAIMELGAVVCSPRQPRCLLCPWQSECQARKDGVQEVLPEKRKIFAVEKVHWAVAVITHRRRVLIVRRTKGRLLKDLWEFPGGEFSETRQVKAILAKRVFQDLGLNIRLLQPLTTIRHTITHRRITLVVFEAQLETAAAIKVRGNEAKWVRREDLEKFPFASASQRIVRILRAAL